MSKKVLFGILFLFLVVIIYASDSDVKVDDKIFEELKHNEEIKVVVVLKDEVQSGIGVFSGSKNVDVKDVIEDANVDNGEEFETINGFFGEVDFNDLNKLVQDNRVEEIYFKKTYGLFLQDSVDLINASVVHDLSYITNNITGKDQTICILDTGINYTHSDFGGCSQTNNISDGSCNKVIGGYDFENSDSDPYDDQGHGTHVSGIAAGNGSMKGVAPGAFIVSVKVCDNATSASCSYVQEGLDWCVSKAELYNISVISMSLGSGAYSNVCDSDSLVPFVNAAIDKNITVVASTGNSGSSTNIASPACITNVTAVSSTDKSDGISTFSDRNSLVRLMAPGTNINASNYTGGYEEKSGTSMAAPHVAGVIALLKQYYNDISLIVNDTVLIQELEETGKEIFDSSNNLTFFRVDAHGALNDTASPRITFNLTNTTMELNQDNQTIGATFTDAFIDAKTSNVSYPNGSLWLDFTDHLILSTDNLSVLGTYTVMAWANDTNGNENTTNTTFILQDTSGTPVVTAFNSPGGDPNYTETNNVIFNVTFESGYNLSNATLYHNFTSWGKNESEVLNTNESSVVFNASFPIGVYVWGVELCDVNNLCNFSENRTVFVDQTDPVVSLVSPNNGSTVNAASVTFNYNVTDFAIDSCNVTVDGIVKTTDSSVSVNAQQSMSTTLSNGNYSWGVTCLDEVARIGSNSIDRNLTVCTPSWTCGAWSDEDDSCGTRTCTDSQGCGTDTGKPDTSESCPSSGSSSGSGASGGGGGTTTTSTDKSILGFSAAAGDTKIFSISKDVGISGLDLEFENAVNDAEVTVEKQDSKPSSVSAVDNVYKYIKINANFVDDDLKEAKIKFKVPQSWILINTLNDPTKVVLQRYTNSEWVKLETLTAGVDKEDQKYEAITPGFSYFAISADKVAVSEIVTTNGNETNATVNETIEEVEENIENSGGLWKKITGGVVKNLFGKGGSWYIYVVIGILVVGLGYLGYRFRRKMKFLSMFGNLTSFFSKISLKIPFDRFRKVRGIIIEEEDAVRGKFKKHHRDAVKREKERLKLERKKLEEERKEIEKFKVEEEK